MNNHRFVSGRKASRAQGQSVYFWKRGNHKICYTQHDYKRVFCSKMAYPLITVLSYQIPSSTSTWYIVRNCPQVIEGIMNLRVSEASQPTAQGLWIEPEVHTW